MTPGQEWVIAGPPHTGVARPFSPWPSVTEFLPLCLFVLSVRPHSPPPSSASDGHARAPRNFDDVAVVSHTGHGILFFLSLSLMMP
jgi:hypothetical protein